MQADLKLSGLLKISVLAEMREMVHGGKMNLGLNTTEEKECKT